MTSHGDVDARKLHSRLKHPIIDVDGHWLEYGPVMREEFRRIGGAAAVEAHALAGQRVPSSLGMTVAERARRRVGVEAFLNANAPLGRSTRAAEMWTPGRPPSDTRHSADLRARRLRVRVRRRRGSVRDSVERKGEPLGCLWGEETGSNFRERPLCFLLWMSMQICSMADLSSR
jgi:hypothetical protein